MSIYVSYLMCVHEEDIEMEFSSNKRSSNRLISLILALKRIKYFDCILLVRGFSRRGDFVITTYLFKMMYNEPLLDDLRSIYLVCLILKSVVVFGFILSPILDTLKWMPPRRKDK